VAAEPPVDSADPGTPPGAVTPPASAAPAPPAPPLAAAPRGPRLGDSAPIVLKRKGWSDGSAIERILEPSGDVVLHNVDAAGTVLHCTKVGSLFTLPVVSQTPAAGGEVIEVVRDESGAVLRFVVQADGEPRAVVLLEPAPLSAR
jgi:hypothetical protein